jgi:hypothetical protein
MHALLTLFKLEGVSEKSIGTTVFFGLRSQQEKCPTCGSGMVGRKDWDGASAHIIGPEADSYNDYLGGFQSVISERMLRDLEERGMTGFVAHRLPIEAVESPKLKRQPMPNYFILEVVGRVDIDRARFDEFDGNLCPTCHKWTPRKGGKYRWGDKTRIPVLDTWDGSDFVMTRNIESGSRYCSRRVLDLAREKQWSGFSVVAFTSGLPSVDHVDPNGLEEFEAAARAKYPEF